MTGRRDMAVTSSVTPPARIPKGSNVGMSTSVTPPARIPKGSNVGMRTSPLFALAAQSPTRQTVNHIGIRPPPLFARTAQSPAREARSPSLEWRVRPAVYVNASRAKTPIISIGNKTAQTSYRSKDSAKPTKNNDAQSCDDRSQNVDGKEQHGEAAEENLIATKNPIGKWLELVDLSTDVGSDSKTSAMTPQIGGQAHRSTHRNPLKLVVFDFDCTLTSIHVFASLAGAVSTRPKLSVFPPFARTERGQMSRLCELDADRSWGPGAFALKAFGGDCRVARLRRFLEMLRNHDVACMIFSRGMVGSIAKCLEQMDLLPFFAQIVGNIGSSMGETVYDCSIPPCSCEAENHLMGQAGDDIGGMGIHKSEHIKRIMEERGLKFHEVVFMDDEFDEIKSAQSTCKCIHVASGMGAQEREFQVLEEMLVELDESEVSISSLESTSPLRSRTAPLMKSQSSLIQPMKLLGESPLHPPTANGIIHMPPTDSSLQFVRRLIPMAMTSRSRYALSMESMRAPPGIVL